MPGDMLERLEIPLMTPHNRDKMRTAYTISVDARDGVSTGISAADRSHTVRTLADSATEPWEITRPGHVFPLRYREGGVLVRRGHTEAAVDLARMAGLTPVGVLVEVVNDDGTMKRGPELRAFADEHGLKMISIEQMVHHRRRVESHVDRVATTRLPTRAGDFTAVGYRISIDGSEHVALVYGDLADVQGGEPVLTRVHSECLTGDVFASSRCDCGPQLEEAMERIVAEGRGVVIYLRGHEGRGIGLLAKLQAYQLQDGGRDTVDANLDLGLPADARHYGAATQILKDLGVTSVRLMTNNPAKTDGLESYGVPVVEQVPLHAAPQRPQRRLPADQARPDGPRAAGPGDQPRRDPPATRPPPTTHHRRSRTMSGEGSPTAQYQAEPFDGSDLRVAVVAASWHDQVMDGLLAGALRALDDFRVGTPRGRPRPGLLRAARRRRRARRPGLRRRGGARRRHPRRHPALRLRLQRRHRRAQPGGARPRGPRRFRAAHLRHRAAGPRPGRPRGVGGGQGLRGHGGGARHGHHAAGRPRRRRRATPTPPTSPLPGAVPWGRPATGPEQAPERAREKAWR